MSQAKPEHYPNLTANVEVSPSHILGALKEDAGKMLEYLHKNEWMQVNCVECKKHLDGMIRMLGYLNNMQATLQAAIDANAEAQAPGTTKQ